MKTFFVWLRAAALSLLGGVVAHAADVPNLTAPVMDLTRTLTPSQVQSLDQALRTFAASKGSQVVVLMVPSIEPEPIEQYSMRVAEAWKIGRKGVDDGVLFVIAKNDRNMRIEVGYGLEGALTDVQAKRIIRDLVTPHFRAGDFYLGVVAGTDAIMRAINGEALPAPTVAERARKPGSDLGSSFPILLFVIMGLGALLRAVLGRFLGASVTSVAALLIVWFFLGTFFVALFFALLAFLGVMFGNARRGGRGWSSGGGFSGGGGGFSGGGGSFGGGGASGRW